MKKNFLFNVLSTYLSCVIWNLYLLSAYVEIYCHHMKLKYSNCLTVKINFIRSDFLLIPSPFFHNPNDVKIGKKNYFLERVKYVIDSVLITFVFVISKI